MSPRLERAAIGRPADPRTFAVSLSSTSSRVWTAPTMIAVLDDDPTGSQTVHDVAIVLALDDADLRLAGDTTFFLTNTRSLPEAEAAALTERVARALFEQDPERRDRQPQRLDPARPRRRRGRGDRARPPRRRRHAATTACCSSPRSSRRGASPATTSTGRATSRSGRRSSPATPRSATRASNLREFVAEKTRRRSASSLSLEDIRAGRAGETPREGRLDRGQRRGLRRPRRGRARRPRVRAHVPVTGPGRRSCARWPGSRRSTR